MATINKKKLNFHKKIQVRVGKKHLNEINKIRNYRKKGLSDAVRYAIENLQIREKPK